MVKKRAPRVCLCTGRPRLLAAWAGRQGGGTRSWVRSCSLLLAASQWEDCGRRRTIGCWHEMQASRWCHTGGRPHHAVPACSRACLDALHH